MLLHPGDEGGHMLRDFYEIQAKDIELAATNPHYKDLDDLKFCVCGNKPYIDASMRLIHCTECGLSFQYRYWKGLVPYHMWQRIHA
jgi:hypothetical protein